MTIYTYSYGITSSFPNQIYAESSLYSEVQNSAITSGIHSIDVDFTYVYFNFKTALSPAEILILDNVVATHTGAELAPQIIVEQGVSGAIPWNIQLIQTQTTQSITGTINVGNFPSTQAVSVSNPVSSVMVSNLPGTQTVSPQTGSVFTVTGNLGAVVSFPLTQSVQLVSGSSAISQGNPLWVTGSILQINQATGTQTVAGTVTVTQGNASATQNWRVFLSGSNFVNGGLAVYITGSSFVQTVSVSNPVNTIAVSNLPGTQTISPQTGSVFAVSVSNPASTLNVGNFPGVQTISPQTGSIFVVTGAVASNIVFPITQAVQLVSGSSAISQGNPLWVTGSVISLPTGVQQVNGTITVAPQTGSSFTVSVSNPINSVLVSNFPGIQTIAPQTGSVFTVTGAVATTITLPATQSVQIVSSLITQSIQGTVSIGNFPSTQTVSVSNPVIVNQGEPGPSPWLITGSITTVQQSGTTAVTIDSNFETYSALALSVGVLSNKSMISIQNGSVDRVVKISSIKIINSQITTVNGVICEFRILRMTGHAAGTLIVPQTFDTADTIDPGITIRTGATISGEAATPLLRYYWSGDEWGAASSKIEGTDHSAQALNSVYSRKLNEKPITLRAGEGLTIKQLTNTSVGTFDFEIIFTEE